MTSEGKETGEKERTKTRERRRREKLEKKTMVALFVSLKVLYRRADPMNVDVGSNKSGDWCYYGTKFTGYSSLRDFMRIDHTRIP